MINILFETSASATDCMLEVWFISEFNFVSMKKNKWWIPAFAIKLASQLIADNVAGNFSVINSIIQLALAIYYAVTISGNKKIRAIISACMFSGILISVSSALYNIYGMLFHDFDSLLMWENSIPRYIYVLTHKVILFAVLLLIVRIFTRDKFDSILGGILSFGFYCFNFAGLALTISAVNESDNEFVQKDMLFIAVILCVLNVFLYVMINHIAKIQKTIYELKLQNSLFAFENKQHEETMRIWNHAAKLRHDVKHHLAVISGMLDEGEIPECREYVSEFLAKTENNKVFSPSGNVVVDYLLDSKLSDLNQTEIILSGSAAELNDIEKTDLASLIGNMLDNAIEATTDIPDRKIEVHFFNHNDTRNIICRNTVAEPVLKNNSTLKTTKTDGMHGYGCQIMNEIVRKYGGIIDYSEENSMFSVMIVLPCKNQNKRGD